MKQIKVIGILGGMGPAATAELYSRLIRLCQVRYNSVQDKDYPKIMIYSLAPSGSDESGVANEEVLESEFIDGIHRLAVSGCEFVILPCNTAHYFLTKLKQHIAVPILSMTDETIKQVQRSGVKLVGILASEDAYRKEVYLKKLRDLGINVVLPTEVEKKKITRVILHVMSGKQDSSDKKILLTIIKRMKEKGAKGVIIGCTELPLVIKSKECPIKAFDTVDILAEATLKEAYK
jgi:aspartate racemase